MKTKVRKECRVSKEKVTESPLGDGGVFLIYRELNSSLKLVKPVLDAEREHEIQLILEKLQIKPTRLFFFFLKHPDSKKEVTSAFCLFV